MLLQEIKVGRLVLMLPHADLEKINKMIRDNMKEKKENETRRESESGQVHS